MPRPGVGDCRLDHAGATGSENHQAGQTTPLAADGGWCDAEPPRPKPRVGPATLRSQRQGTAKKSLAAGRLPFDQGMAVEAEQFQRSFASDDAREGIDAFVAKRDAQFKGR